MNNMSPSTHTSEVQASASAGLAFELVDMGPGYAPEQSALPCMSCVCGSGCMCGCLNAAINTDS